MALRTILHDDTDDVALRKRSRPVTTFGPRLSELLDDLRETLHASGGVGLAAPQVGVLRRVVVIAKEDGTVLELVNPTIKQEEGEQDGLEGCLSIPGRWGYVKRPMTVTVSALDRAGNPFETTDSGLIARAFCHELEHLDGHLFIDRASRILTEEDLDKLEEEEAQEDPA